LNKGRRAFFLSWKLKAAIQQKSRRDPRDLFAIHTQNFGRLAPRADTRMQVTSRIPNLKNFGRLAPRGDPRKLVTLRALHLINFGRLAPRGDPRELVTPPHVALAPRIHPNVYSRRPGEWSLRGLAAMPTDVHSGCPRVPRQIQEGQANYTQWPNECCP
jgi:hypothetical protein